MAQGTEFTDRRDPKLKGRRSSDARSGVGDLVGTVAHTAGRAMAGALGMAADAAGQAAKAMSKAGKATPSSVDGSAEELHWREHYAGAAFYDPAFSFEDYLPALRAGWEGCARLAGRTFDEVERDLKAEFHWNRGKSRLLWEQAREAARAAFERPR